jgi:hypothetical protein
LEFWQETATKIAAVLQQAASLFGIGVAAVLFPQHISARDGASDENPNSRQVVKERSRMHLDFAVTISRVSSMFSIFRGKDLSERMRAIKKGRLIDMQLAPFRQFNVIVNNILPTVMTHAAYQACVQLPGEEWKADVPVNARWGIVYLTFLDKFQHWDEDLHEGTFDVSVLMPGGFQVSKTVKVIADNDFDGDNAFVFLLPDESWPACISN